MAGIVVICGTFGLAAAGWILVHPVVRDPYPFLGGRRATFEGVMGPGSWSAKQLRAYTWKQPWREVAAVAKKELPGHGLTQVTSTEGASWMGEMIDGGPCGIGSDTQLDVMPGRANPLTMSGAFTDKDPEWVSVFVATDLEDSWLNVLRYTFLPIPEK